MKGLIFNIFFCFSVVSPLSLSAMDLFCADALTYMAEAKRQTEILSIYGSEPELHAHSLLTSFSRSEVYATAVAIRINYSYELFLSRSEDFEEAERFLDALIEGFFNLPQRAQIKMINAIGPLMLRANKEEEELIQIKLGSFLLDEVIPQIRSGERPDWTQSTLITINDMSRATRILPALIPEIGVFLIESLASLKTRGLARRALINFGSVYDEMIIAKIYDLMENDPFTESPPEGGFSRVVRWMANLGFQLALSLPVDFVPKPVALDRFILKLYDDRNDNAAYIRDHLSVVAYRHPNPVVVKEARRILSRLERISKSQ